MKKAGQVNSIYYSRQVKVTNNSLGKAMPLAWRQVLANTKALVRLHGGLKEGVISMLRHLADDVIHVVGHLVLEEPPGKV